MTESVEFVNLYHDTSKMFYDGTMNVKHQTSLTFDVPTVGNYHIDVKNGKISEHPEQRSLDTLPSEYERIVRLTSLLAHAHLSTEYGWSYDG